MGEGNAFAHSFSLCFRRSRPTKGCPYWQTHPSRGCVRARWWKARQSGTSDPRPCHSERRRRIWTRGRQKRCEF